MPTVATKLTTMFSLATVKAYLEVSDSSRDVLIQQLADAVSEKFEQRTSRRIVTRTGLTDTWNGDGGRAHFLPFMDVTTLTSLAIDGVSVDPADVVLDGHLGLIQLKDSAAVGCFRQGVGNCVAVFSCGWGAQDAATLPSDVVETCLEWAKAIYDEKLSGATAASSVTIGPASLIVKPGLGVHIKQTLDDWKDVRG